MAELTMVDEARRVREHATLEQFANDTAAVLEVHHAAVGDVGMRCRCEEPVERFEAAIRKPVVVGQVVHEVELNRDLREGNCVVDARHGTNWHELAGQP